MTLLFQGFKFSHEGQRCINHGRTITSLFILIAKIILLLTFYSVWWLYQQCPNSKKVEAALPFILEPACFLGGKCGCKSQFSFTRPVTDHIDINFWKISLEHIHGCHDIMWNSVINFCWLILSQGTGSPQFLTLCGLMTKTFEIYF